MKTLGRNRFENVKEYFDSFTVDEKEEVVQQIEKEIIDEVFVQYFPEVSKDAISTLVEKYKARFMFKARRLKLHSAKKSIVETETHHIAFNIKRMEELVQSSKNAENVTNNRPEMDEEEIIQAHVVYLIKDDTTIHVTNDDIFANVTTPDIEPHKVTNLQESPEKEMKENTEKEIIKVISSKPAKQKQIDEDDDDSLNILGTIDVDNMSTSKMMNIANVMQSRAHKKRRKEQKVEAETNQTAVDILSNNVNKEEDTQNVGEQEILDSVVDEPTKDNGKPTEVEDGAPSGDTSAQVASKKVKSRPVEGEKKEEVKQDEPDKDKGKGMETLVLVAIDTAKTQSLRIFP
ncbi:RNA polymerase II degradation factor 1-like [Cryptomeria japonica]|uniref:RNA polymerase II degradation factor 1-like n=1 Tax=Cryptomeria japonica TaxID=3369 RepID=UPI0027DA13E5|nr:RNA polymerase II degradation factor 1-like [Cryptomeria japonica]